MKGPCKKQAWKTLKAAQKHKRWMYEYKNRELWVYRCLKKECGKYHVSSRNDFPAVGAYKAIAK